MLNLQEVKVSMLTMMEFFYGKILKEIEKKVGMGMLKST